MLLPSHSSDKDLANGYPAVIKNLLFYALKRAKKRSFSVSAPRANQGFTLIEILVTLVITGIMAAIATPSFLNWYNNKKIEDATAQVEGILKVVQSTAVKHNISCTVTIGQKQVSATPNQCLSKGISLSRGTNANIATEGTGGVNITFSSKGTATIVADTSVIVIYDQQAPTSRKMKCIVVSNGIGMMRTGNYQGDGPPADDANVNDVEARCVTPS